MITKEQLEDKLKELKSQEEQLKCNVFAVQGAIQVVNQFLSEESLSMNDLKDMLGAKEIGEPEEIA